VILTLSLLVASVGAGLGFKLFRQAASPKESARGHAAISVELAAEAAARAHTLSWVLHQVSRAAIVSCDYRLCADLATIGFPPANLMPLGPMSSDPVGSDLLIATADIRAQFGRRLASVYAPAVLASFGSGNARIDIRLVFPAGAKRYRAIQQAALRARKAADAQLLTNTSITLSATARAQLLSGSVDPRLPLMIVAMAAGHPLHIVDFSSQSPGGGPASLLRWVDLATTDRAGHTTRAAYVRWMLAFIYAQRTPYRPSWAHQVTLPDGQSVLQIGYGAPSRIW